MNVKNNKKARPGVALLVVLFIVMAITILSLGFVSRSDVELACGQNMILRTEMDYLAESGLEHARGLILNPQDVSTEFWKGGTGLQLVSGSSDYYDVTVNQDPNDHCNYIIECISYRRAPDGSDIGRSSLRAELRLDPCIAYWAGSSTTISSEMVINGDVYCGGTLTNNGFIDGDVFATIPIAGTGITKGQEKGSVAPVPWPGLVIENFGPTIYHIGSTEYSAQQIAGPDIPTTPFVFNETNPAGILYSIGDVNMPGGVTINGTLVVSGDLTVSGENSITAEPNFPALVVGGQVIMENGGSLVINGLAQIGGPITDDPNTTNADISVTGGLFIANGGVTSDRVLVNITAAPAIAAIETWLAVNTAKRWSPAAGAFFRSIERIK